MSNYCVRLCTEPKFTPKCGRLNCVGAELNSMRRSHRLKRATSPCWTPPAYVTAISSCRQRPANCWRISAKSKTISGCWIEPRARRSRLGKELRANCSRSWLVAARRSPARIKDAAFKRSMTSCSRTTPDRAGRSAGQGYRSRRDRTRSAEQQRQGNPP